MQFSTIAAVLFATLAIAAPTEPESYGKEMGMSEKSPEMGMPEESPEKEGKGQWLQEKGDGSGDQYCSEKQKAACCNGSNENGNGSILGGVLGGVLGGNCDLSIIGGQCNQGSIACCPTDGQTGLVNVGSICAPISA